MRYLIASFHNGNLPECLLIAQRKVLAHYGIPILQWYSTLTHGEAIDECLSAHPTWDVACLMDADAFCRNPVWLWETMRELCEAKKNAYGQEIGIIGGAHNANHRCDTPDYASPACCIISRRCYELAKEHGCLGFRGYDPQDGKAPKDVGQHLSDTLRGLGFCVELLEPVSVRTPKWKLMCGEMFGNGTDYGNFYHEFESRFGENPAHGFTAKVDQELSLPRANFELPASKMDWVQTIVSDGLETKEWCTTRIFVLSLARERTRRLSVLQQFAGAGLEFEMIDAVDAKALRPELLAVPSDAWDMSVGEVACYLSHLGILQRVVDYNLDYAIILEDDMRITGEGSISLESIWEHMPIEVDHMQLHNMGNSVVDVGHRIITSWSSQHFRKVNPTSAMTVGYIISRRLAQHILDKHSIPRKPIDHLFIDISAANLGFGFFETKDRLVDVIWNIPSCLDRKANAPRIN